MKIHNIFHLNLFQKTALDLVINQVNKLLFLVIINNDEEWKLKISLMLKLVTKKFNTKLNRLAVIKTRNAMMLLNLLIFQKLLRIFIFVIPINYELN